MQMKCIQRKITRFDQFFSDNTNCFHNIIYTHTHQNRSFMSSRTAQIIDERFQ